MDDRLLDLIVSRTSDTLALFLDVFLDDLRDDLRLNNGRWRRIKRAASPSRSSDELHHPIGDGQYGYNDGADHGCYF